MTSRIVNAALAALLATAWSTASHAQRTSLGQQYDRIEGRTVVGSSVFSRSPMVGPSVDLDAVVFFRDSVRPPGPIDSVALIFRTVVSGGQGWVFLESHDLTLLVDDSLRLRYPGDRRSGPGPIGFGFYERVTVVASIEDLGTIVHGAKVEGRVGPWAFRLSPAELARLRELWLYAFGAPGAPVPRRGRVIM